MACTMAVTVHAQSIWLPPSNGNQVSLEIVKVDYNDNVADVTFTSLVWYFSGRITPIPALTLVGELPVSRMDENEWPFYSYDPDPQTAFGNPYLGGEYRSVGGSVITEFGLRLPVAPDDKGDAELQGVWSDADRWEAWLPNLVSMRLRIGMDATTPTPSMQLVTRFRVGPTLWIPTEGDNDVELFADAVAGLWFQPRNAMFGLTLSSRTLLTEQGPNFWHRSEFQLGLDANATFGRLRPGVHFHVPLGDEGLWATGTATNFTYGLNLTVLFPQVAGI